MDLMQKSAIANSNGNERRKVFQQQPMPQRKQFQPRTPMQGQQQPTLQQRERSAEQQSPTTRTLEASHKQKFKSALEDLFGTRGAYLLDEKFNVLGKVPVSELRATIKSVTGVHAIVMDGTIDRELVKSAETARVQYLVSMESQVKNGESAVVVLTDAELV